MKTFSLSFLTFSSIWTTVFSQEIQGDIFVIELLACVRAQSCLTLWNQPSCPTLCVPMDYTVHGILQARILQWVAFPFSRGSSQPRDPTQVSHIANRFFTSWPIKEFLSKTEKNHSWFSLKYGDCFWFSLSKMKSFIYL